MSTFVECRTCLGMFSDDDSVHVETKVINQKNVLQAIEEIASIEVLENVGLPQHICKKCFTSLESSVTFRTKVIKSQIELNKRLLLPEKDYLNGINATQSYKKNEDEKDDEYKEDVKQENEELGELLEKQEIIPLDVELNRNNNTGIKSSEAESDSDWNGCNEDMSSSDDPLREESNHKSSLRNSKFERKKHKTDVNDDNISANEILSAVRKKDETDTSDDNDEDVDVVNHKIKTKSSTNCRNSKSSIDSQRKRNNYSDDNNSSGDISNEKEKNKCSNKKTVVGTRTIRRKKRITRKPRKDISDTSSDSNSDSDIPLEELRKEIKDLENKTEPKIRKKREKKENDGPRLCPICGKLFKARQNFNSHMTTVHRKKPDKPEKISCLCPDCGRVITGTRQNFVAHRRYHHSDKAQVKKRFTCDVCPRKFYREKNLIIHQRIHKGEKGYVCELCPDKSYTQIGGLILHKRKVHLKKPTCTCNYCGKQFYEKHYLETHIRQWHTGERPFSCEICGKSFSCNGTLLRHRKDSHGEKQPCPKCGKMYTEGELRKHLKRHKIREEGIKRKKYTCEYCGTEMNFTSRKRHLLKQHGIMLRGRGETAERIPISRADAM